MRDFLTLKVPEFNRLSDYVDAWAIEPGRGAAMLDRYQRSDLKRHILDEDKRKDGEAKKAKAEVPFVTAGNNQKIAVITLTGPLMKSVGSMDEGTSTVRTRRDLREAASNPDYSAILLAIDSPGGTVAGTASLASDIRDAQKRKPVWAFADDLCASAAYWLASQCDKFFANDRTALIGSIGTLIVVYDLSQWVDFEGIRTLVIGTGPLKGAAVPGSAVTPEQEEYFRQLVEDSQVSFDQAVRKGRGLTEKQLADAKTGGVFGATEAMQRGLIDGIKGFDAVITELAAEARRRSREASRATSSATKGKKMDETLEVEAGQLVTLQPGVQTLTAADVRKTVAEEIVKQREAAAAELERQSAIAKHCGDNKDLAAKAIRENWSVDKAELEAMKAGLANGVRAFSPAIIVNGHDKNCTMEALQGAMILRHGGSLDAKCYQSMAGLSMKLPQWLRAGLNSEQRQRAMELAHRYSDMSAVDLCREAIRIDGREAPHARQDLIRAAFSGGSLTNIFTTSVNARLLATYMERVDLTDGWTSSTDVADFKTNERPRMTKGPGLAKLPRGAEADHYTRSDLVETYKIARYAKQMVIDEQDIIDDSMNAFDDTPIEMGKAAARLRPDLVYAILLSNDALGADSVALFHSTHANLNTTAALTSANLKVAIAAMEKMRENGVNLELKATHLVVPSDLKHTGAELINSSQILLGADDESVRGNLNTINSEESITLVSTARLANGVTDPADGEALSGSATTWYLASSMGHNIEVGYLRGTGRAPQVRSFVLDKGTWGIGWDVNMDIGAKALDYRGMQKNTA